MPGFGGAVKLKGESAYKQALKQITQNLKELSSEMKVASSAYDKNDNAISKVRSKSEILNRTLTEQKQKLATVTAEYGKMSAKAAEQAAKHEQLTKTYEAEKAKLDEIAATSGKTSEEYQKQQKVVNGLAGEVRKSTSANDANNKTLSDMRVQMNDAQAAVNKTEAEIVKYNAEIDKMESEQKQAESATSKLNDEIKDQSERLQQLKKAYADSVLETGRHSKESKDLAKQISGLSGDLEKNKAALSNAESAADRFDKTLDDTGESAATASDGFTVMKGVLADLASTAIQKAVDGLKDLAQQTFEAGSNFEASMSNVQAISGATGDEMLKLKDKAEEMGAKTKFTATEAGDAMSYMAMAGWKTSDMLNGIEGIMNLAAASGEDLATTSDIVTDALTAMGYSAGDAGELADVMAAASSNANTNVGLMGATFQYAAPIVGALGYNMQDTAVAIGLMANAGIKGEKSGTALRSILTRLSAPPKECAEAMDTLGISLTDSEGNMKSLDTVMQDLRGAFSGLSETQQTQYAKSIAGQEAMSGLLSIVNAAPADYDKLTDAVRNCSGASEEMANTMNDNVTGQITLLKSKIEGIMIKVFDKASGSIRDAIDKISAALDKIDWDKVADALGRFAEKIADAFGYLLDHGNEIVGILAAIVAGFAAFKTFTAITQLISGFSKFFEIIKAGKGVMAALNATMALNPIGLIVTAIAAAVAAFVYFWNTSESFRNFWIGLWDNIKSVTGAAVDAIKGFFTKTIPDAFNGALDHVKSFGSSIADFFTKKIPNAFKSFTDALGKIPGNVKNFCSSVINSIKTWAGNMANQALNAGKNFLNNIVTFFQQLPERVGYFIGYVMGTVIKFAIEFPQKAAQAASDFLSAVVQFMQQLPGSVASFLSTVISNVVNWASQMANNARNAGRNFLNGAVQFIQQLPGRVASFLSNVISNVVNWASQMSSNAQRAGANFLNNAISNMIALPGRVAGLLSSVISGVANFAANMASQGARAAGNLARNIINGIASLPSQVANVGRNIVYGIWNGISGAAGWLYNQVASFARGILRGMKNALGIKSPSRVFRDEVGKYIAQGIGVGFTDEMKAVTADMQDAIPKSFDMPTAEYTTGRYSTESGYNGLVDAFKQALSEMKIEMDGDEMGKFVDKTVTRLVYA